MNYLFKSPHTKEFFLTFLKPACCQLQITTIFKSNFYSHIISLEKDFDEYKENEHLRDGIKMIHFNLKETRNALSVNIMKRLINNIKQDEDNPELRCIVLAANGNVFSAGHDLKEFIYKNDPELKKEVFETAEELMKTIIQSPVPIIAKVDGVAAAAGCQLVAQCDLAVASDSSLFCTPGVNVGLFCSTPGVALSRCVPRKIALQMLLTGKTINAEEALRYGLINKIASQDKLEDAIDELIDPILSKSRDVIALGKEFFYKQIEMSIHDAYAKGSKKMLENLDLPDCKKGISYFFEKKINKNAKNEKKIIVE